MTIAQQLNVKEFPFEIKDSKGNRIYYEGSYGFWYKSEHNLNGKEIYYENNDGFWSKREYDLNGILNYYENSDGLIRDNRPKQKEYTMDEIAKSLNINVNQLKIKK